MGPSDSGESTLTHCMAGLDSISADSARIGDTEPTGNLDSRASADILRFLRDPVRDLGQTVVMVTHDQVVFLADGRVVDEMAEPTAERGLEHVGRYDAGRQR
jgi:ABC-type lipoprotein export system ATPase subunit